MVIVYWQFTVLEPVGSWSIARYGDEEDMYPVNENDRSYWIVPGTEDDE